MPRINDKFDRSGNFNDPAIYEKLEGQVLRFIQFANKLNGA